VRQHNKTKSCEGNRNRKSLLLLLSSSTDWAVIFVFFIRVVLCTPENVYLKFDDNGDHDFTLVRKVGFSLSFSTRENIYYQFPVICNNSNEYYDTNFCHQINKDRYGEC
jgi:hypothetical protein